VHLKGGSGGIRKKQPQLMKVEIPPQGQCILQHVTTAAWGMLVGTMGVGFERAPSLEKNLTRTTRQTTHSSQEVLFCGG